MTDATTDAVVVTAVMSPHPGRVDEVLAGLADAIPAVHAETGCLLYAAHRAENDSVVLIEKWATAADFAAHGSGAARDALRARLDGLLVAPTVVEVLAPVALGEPGKNSL